LSYQDYQGQVLEFLGEEDREQYDSVSAWEEFQGTVLALLSHEN
jgi:hypothetical protein